MLSITRYPLKCSTRAHKWLGDWVSSQSGRASGRRLLPASCNTIRFPAYSQTCALHSHVILVEAGALRGLVSRSRSSRQRITSGDWDWGSRALAHALGTEATRSCQSRPCGIFCTAEQHSSIAQQQQQQQPQNKGAAGCLRRAASPPGGSARARRVSLGAVGRCSHPKIASALAPSS